MLGLPASTLESKIRGLKNRETSMQGPDGQFLKPSPFRSATASTWFAALHDFAIFAIFNFVASR